MYRNLSSKSLGLSGRQSEIIEAALSYKFQSMTLNMDEFASDVQSFGMPHARRFIDSAGIKIACFNLPIQGEDWEGSDKEFQEVFGRIPQVAEFAGQLGCTRALTTISPANDFRPYPENFETYRKRIGEVVSILKVQNIRLGLELVGTSAERRGRAFQFIHNFEALGQLAKMTSPQHVGVVADLWQMHLCGAGIEALRSVPRERLVAVSLSDLPANANLETVTESSRLMPGETGVLDCVGALKILAEIEYDGPVTARVAAEHVPGKNRNEKIRSISEKLNQLWDAAGLSSAGPVATETSN